MSAGNPNFANGVPTVDTVAFSATAQTAISGLTTSSTGMNLVASGTANGKRINRAFVTQSAAWAAGIINWWFNPTGTTVILIASTAVAANTPSTTNPASKTYEPSLAGFNLPNGTNLYMTTTIAQAGYAATESGNY